MTFLFVLSIFVSIWMTAVVVCRLIQALLCLTDGTYQARCMICDVYYDVEIAKHRKRAKEK